MARVKRYATLLVALMLPVVISMGMVEEGYSDPNDIEVLCRILPCATGLENDSFEVVVQISNLMAADSIGGVELWINISDPDLIQFDVDSSWWLLDSTCLGFDGETCTLWQYDSIIELATGVYDTNGTVMSGWEYLESRVLGGNRGVAKVSALADLSAPPRVPGYPPSFGDTLIRLYAHTNGVLGDSLCDSAAISFIISRSQTRFSNSEGDLIGCGSYEWDVDTFFFNCAEFIEDSCVAWLDTVYDSIYECIIDTTQIVLVDLDTLNLQCCDWSPGDADNNAVLNISDAVYILAYIFGGGPAPIPNVLAGDWDCNCLVNISDAVYCIAYIFGGGPPPPLTCSELTGSCP
jgi:hypothetical protein